jgi:penicillin-binding protein 1A
VLIAAYEYGIDPKREFPSRSLDGGGWPAEPSGRCRGRSMTLTDALTNSCNRPFTWAAYELAGKLKRIVYRFGLTPPGAPALVPLGSLETSPLQLARAYASVVNEGRVPRLRSLVAALGPRGNVLYAPVRYSRAIMSPETAALVREALRKPVLLGTARNADSPHAVVYGKTGTTSHNRDALFVGVTEDYAGAFWIGDDNNKSMQGVHGSGAPARAFRWGTDAYYTSTAASARARVLEEPAAWQAWIPDFLQDRTVRYYVLLAFAALGTGLAGAGMRTLRRPWRIGVLLAWIASRLIPMRLVRR